jgi:hypothetical protein
MNAAGNWDAIFADHVEFHTVLIHLGQLGWSRNGKGKREGRLPFSPNASLLTALLSHPGLLLERLDVPPDLIVAWEGEGHAGILP